MPPAAFRFGDLVRVVTAPEKGVGLVAEARSSDGRVVHLATGRSAWVPLRVLRRAEPAEVEGSLEQLVSELLALLGATEMELTPRGPGLFRLAASHGAIGADAIDALRARLGSRLAAFLLRPSGMHRIQSVVEFRF